MDEMIDSSQQGKEDGPASTYRILALDGGGSKGFYGLGVLKEIEGMLDRPLHEVFDLVFGTSTGAIIGSLIALGYEIDDILSLYQEHVPNVMAKRSAKARSMALSKLSLEVFEDKTFEDVKTGIEVIATKWIIEQPMIFKGSVKQAHGRKGTFTPGFGVNMADAVQASCSAYPLFERKTVTTNMGDMVELIDGGYCANNPTLYAISDAVATLEIGRKEIRVVNVGVGVYPEPKSSFIMSLANKYLVSVQLLQKTLEINTQSMEQLRQILFKDVETVRISDTFKQPEMATNLMEHNLDKLNILWQRGRESFATREAALRQLLI